MSFIQKTDEKQQPQKAADKSSTPAQNTANKTSLQDAATLVRNMSSLSNK